MLLNLRGDTCVWCIYSLKDVLLKVKSMKKKVIYQPYFVIDFYWSEVYEREKNMKKTLFISVYKEQKKIRAIFHFYKVISENIQQYIKPLPYFVVFRHYIQFL